MAVMDNRNQSKTKLSFRDHALLYGYRPRTRSDVWYVSAYEFAMTWEPVLLSYTVSLEENKLVLCHAVLTKSGERKIIDSPKGDADLVPGIDYVAT